MAAATGRRASCGHVMLGWQQPSGQGDDALSSTWQGEEVKKIQKLSALRGGVAVCGL